MHAVGVREEARRTTSAVEGGNCKVKSETATLKRAAGLLEAYVPESTSGRKRSESQISGPDPPWER